MEAPVVVPVGPAGGRVFDVLKGPVGAAMEHGRADALGLEQSVGRLYEGVVVRVTDGPDGGRDAVESEMLGQTNCGVLRSGIAVMNQMPW